MLSFATIFALIISLIIYLKNKHIFPDPAAAKLKKNKDGSSFQRGDHKWLPLRSNREYMPLFLQCFGNCDILLVLFHQNGYSLTYFARDYINLDIINLNLGFTSIKGAEIFPAVNPFFVVVTYSPYNVDIRIFEKKRQRALYAQEDRYTVWVSLLWHMYFCSSYQCIA